MVSRTVLLAISCFLLTGMMHGQESAQCPMLPTSLKAMRNCYRPVLVFAPNARNKSLLTQQAMLDKYADEMMDRSLLYVPVLADPAHFEKPLDSPYALLSMAHMNAIRGRFRIAPSEFVVVLLGKDGGEKFRTVKPISVLKLDELVDAMPMRQQEIGKPAAQPKK